VSAGPGRRKEKKDTLNAARRSMAMAEEVKVAVGAAQANHKRFESPPQWLSTPSSSNSSPRSLILSPATLPLEDAWAAISDVAGQSGCFVWPCGHKGPWRKNHPMLLSDHGHYSSPQYKMALSLPPHPNLSLFSTSKWLWAMFRTVA
jgi:hypothetical protein